MSPTHLETQWGYEKNELACSHAVSEPLCPQDLPEHVCHTLLQTREELWSIREESASPFPSCPPRGQQQGWGELHSCLPCDREDLALLRCTESFLDGAKFASLLPALRCHIPGG